MTIALSVGIEHFPCSTTFDFNFNPNWLLFNNRANRKGVINKFTSTVDAKACVLIERTLVINNECKSEWFIFNGARLDRRENPTFWDESRQSHSVDGVWKSLGPMSYRLRFIEIDAMRREPCFTQPYMGASFIDATVIKSVLEDIRVDGILSWIDSHTDMRQREALCGDILRMEGQRQ